MKSKEGIQGDRSIERKVNYLETAHPAMEIQEYECIGNQNGTHEQDENREVKIILMEAK